VRIKTQLQALVGVGALAAFGLAQAGEMAVTSENEARDALNHPIASAKALTPAVIVNGYLGDVIGDVDFYTFEGTENDDVTIRVDGISGQEPFDAGVALFTSPDDSPDGTRTILDEDRGFMGELPTLENINLPYTGTYVIGVSNANRMFLSSGELDPNTAHIEITGDYALSIEGATSEPEIETISIAVNPGEDRKKLNPKANYLIPVAILSQPGFRALTVDRDSLTFGATGTEDSFSKCDYVGRDINGDNMIDLVCYFQNRKAGWDGSEDTGIVNGETTDGLQFTGKGGLNMVPKY